MRIEGGNLAVSYGQNDLTTCLSELSIHAVHKASLHNGLRDIFGLKVADALDLFVPISDISDETYCCWCTIRGELPYPLPIDYPEHIHPMHD